MDIDFHYYVTYIAARAAGFPKDEAQIIALCAQYVDDSTTARMSSTKRKNIAGEDVTVTPTQTAHYIGLSSNFWNALDNKQFVGQTSTHTALVWCAFHFLPGNFGFTDDDGRRPAATEGYERVYLGVDDGRLVLPPRYNGFLLDSLNRGSEGIRTLDGKILPTNLEKLVCVRDSVTARAMIEDTLNYPRQAVTRDDVLARICLAGVRAHVYADTFAHEGFAGVSLGALNHVDEVRPMTIQGGHRLCVENARFVPPSGFKKSTTAPLGKFGHGRIGHLPDRPAVSYTYIRPSDGKRMFRSNPYRYQMAYTHMVAALRRVRDTLPQDPSPSPWNDQTLNVDFFRELGMGAQARDLFLTAEQDTADTTARCTSLRDHIRGRDQMDLADYLTNNLADMFYAGQSALEYPVSRMLLHQFSRAAAYHKDWVSAYVEQNAQINLLQTRFDYT